MNIHPQRLYDSWVSFLSGKNQIKRQFCNHKYIPTENCIHLAILRRKHLVCSINLTFIKSLYRQNTLREQRTWSQSEQHWGPEQCCTKGCLKAATAHSAQMLLIYRRNTALGQTAPHNPPKSSGDASKCQGEVLRQPSLGPQSHISICRTHLSLSTNF